MVLISSLGVITGRLLPSSIRQLVTSMEKEGTSYTTLSRTPITNKQTPDQPHFSPTTPHPPHRPPLPRPSTPTKHLPDLLAETRRMGFVDLRLGRGERDGGVDLDVLRDHRGGYGSYDR